MSGRIWLVGLVVLLVCAAGWQSLATAATTGKVAGRVMDEGGKPLPGVNLVLGGTRKGAVSDTDGFYAILLVEPGDYNLAASLIGYEKVVQQAVRVVVGYTTTVNFRLKETPVEAGEVVVIADRPSVEPDKTASKYYVTAKDIEQMPVVKDVQSLVGLQPGVQHDGLTVRQGSLATDGIDGTPNDARAIGFDGGFPRGLGLSYTVDGVRLVSGDARVANTFTGVNRTSVQEISVVTGVPEAEYGNMDAGVINIVTKEGGQSFHGFLEYRYTLPGQKHFGLNAYDPRVHIDTATGKSHIGNYLGSFKDNPRANWLLEKEDIGPDKIPGTADDKGRLVHAQPDDYTKVVGHRLEGSLSGPLGKNVSFHVSAQTNREPRQQPWPDLRTLPNYQLTGKLAFSVTPKISLKVGGVFGRDQAFRVTQNSALSEGRNIFLPAGQSDAGREIMRNWMGYAVLTHALSPKTLYELRISRSDAEQDTLDVPEDTENVVRDADNWFTVRQRVRDFRLDRQTRHNVKLDFSSQVTKRNFFKAGIDATWYRSWQWEENSLGQAGRYSAWTIYDYSEAAKNRYGKDGKIDFVPIRAGTAYQPDFAGAGNLDDPAWTGYRDYPRRAFQFSAYAQDKMEFEGMVINVGLRLDTFFQKGQFTAEPFWGNLPSFRFLGDAEAGMARQGQKSYPGDPTAFPLWEGNDMVRVSPRFGASHPITSRSAIHFSYGRFFTLPVFYTMYGQHWNAAGGLTMHQDLNRDSRLSSYEYLAGLEFLNTRGSAQIDAPTTVNYELGMDWNFVSDYTATATAFYRRGERGPVNDGASFWDPATKAFRGSTWYWNSYSNETRGFEVAISKRFSNTFSFRASYSWYWEQNNFASYPNDVKWFPDGNFIASGIYRTQFLVDPQTGERVWQPLTAADIAALTPAAETQIRTAVKDPQFSFRPSEKFKSIGAPGAEIGLPITPEPNIAVQAWGTYTGTVRGPESKRDSPSDGSISLLFATPPGFGPKVGGVNPLDDMNLNLVLRIEPGTFFPYTVPFPAPATNNLVLPQNAIFTRNPVALTTDLGVEKGFRMGGLRPVVFFEATNLFNGRKPRPIQRFVNFNNIPKYGLQQNQPDPKQVRDQQVIWDLWQSYRNRTREIYFGVRMSL